VRDVRAGGLYQSWAGVGAHELFLETPRHNVAFGSGMSLAEVYAVVSLWARRYRVMATAGQFAMAVLFKNNGAEAGAPQHHSHSQLLGLPVMPTHTAHLLDEARNYFHVNGCCVFCQTLRQLAAPPSGEADGEAIGHELVIHENTHFVAYCPWSSLCDYAITIMPREHHADLLLDCSDVVLIALADVLRHVTRKLYWFSGD
jgi:UDPglucose--hexose-1-phosphate uridylyltransferase